MTQPLSAETGAPLKSAALAPGTGSFPWCALHLSQGVNRKPSNREFDVLWCLAVGVHPEHTLTTPPRRPGCRPGALWRCGGAAQAVRAAGGDIPCHRALRGRCAMPGLHECWDAALRYSPGCRCESAQLPLGGTLVGRAPAPCMVPLPASAARAAAPLPQRATLRAGTSSPRAAAAAAGRPCTCGAAAGERLWGGRGA